MERKIPRALVLFSGGLDSILAIKLLQNQNLAVEAINFVTPFSGGLDYVGRAARKLGVKVHKAKVDPSYFSLIRKPKHGYGANMNPCLDCKIWMLRKAKSFAKAHGYSFIATGEVLGERPFSQKKDLMLLIEKEAGLAGKVVRPLSGKLLPETEAERKGLVSREKMLAISGRGRKPQLGLARKFRIGDFPTPGGGCLLTDPGFSRKLRDFLKHNKTFSWEDIEILKLGRHFRLGKGKIIVGRNHKENLALRRIASRQDLGWMEAQGFMGPITVVLGSGKGLIRKAASLTARYSDAPKERPAKVVFRKGKSRRILEAKPILEKEIEKLRV